MDSCSDIHPLPENCIANIISLTSPVDACRMSAVALIFHSAAESDAVWEHFLPSNYREIISRASPDSPLNNFQSKKALYMYLCDNPILIDEGTRAFGWRNGVERNAAGCLQDICGLYGVVMIRLAIGNVSLVLNPDSRK